MLAIRHHVLLLGEFSVGGRSPTPRVEFCVVWGGGGMRVRLLGAADARPRYDIVARSAKPLSLANLNLNIGAVGSCFCLVGFRSDLASWIELVETWCIRQRREEQ